MSQEQVAAAVIITLISKKNKSMKKDRKEMSVSNCGLKERKNLDLMKLCELQLEDKL